MDSGPTSEPEKRAVDVDLPLKVMPIKSTSEPDPVSMGYGFMFQDVKAGICYRQAIHFGGKLSLRQMAVALRDLANALEEGRVVVGADVLVGHEGITVIGE